MRPLFFLISFIIATQIAAQEQRLKTLLSYSFPTELAASKIQGAIAWVENKEGVRNIHYAIAPEYRPVKLTNYTEDDGQVISNLEFTEDGETIIYVRGGAPNRSGEFPNPTSNPEGYKREIHSVNIISGMTKNLGMGAAPISVGENIIYLNKGGAWMMNLKGENATSLFTLRGSVSSIRLSPDKSKIAFVDGRGDHSFIGIFSLKSKKLTLVSPSIDFDSDPVWSPNGRQLAFLRQGYEKPLLFVPKREAQPFSILVADSETGKSEVIFKADKGKGSAFQYISAENQLFWTAGNEVIFPWEKEGWTQLYSIPTNGGTPTLITPGSLEVQYITQSPDRLQIIFNSNQNDIDRQHLWGYDDKLTQLTTGKGIEWLPVIDGTGAIFCLGSSGTQPADVKQINSG
ncbi:MAG: DPP IV N-terminal domain-containing protein [Croceivirga sp.]